MSTEPSMAVQRAIMERLKANPLKFNGVQIQDAGKPLRYPAIILGQAFTAFPDYNETFHITTTADVHVWTESADLISVKQITNDVRNAIMRGPWTVDDHICINLLIESARFMRDPDGLHSHAVLSVTAILQEVVSL